MFGFENNEQLAGTSILTRIAPSHRQQVLDYMERRAAGENVPSLYESRGIKANGREFDLEVGLSTYSLHGEIYSIGIIRDITERKQAEMRMQMFSHEIVTARENEREHLSSVLHQDVGSLAVGVSAYLGAIEDDLRSGKPGKALRWLPRTRKLVDQSLKRLKGLAVELRPPELDVLGLGAALRQHFSQVTKRGGIRIRFKEGQHGKRWIGDTAIVLFRVAQEALTNAIRHGHAKRVNVDLLTLKKEIRLTIRDNGKGFDSSGYMNLPISHLGIRVMREMADFIGGAFTIQLQSRQGNHGAPDSANQDRRFRRPKLPNAERQPPMSIRVVIADDHPVVRDGLRLAIERHGKDIVIAGEASDGRQVLEIARTKPADVFVLDATMPKMNGIEAARDLRKEIPGAKIIIMSLHDTRAMVEEALAVGARGYLTKETATRNVVDAVTEVHAGGFYLCPRIAHYVVESSLKEKKGRRKRGAAAVALTTQERKVLQLIAEGRSTKEVASELGLSFNTVHTHRSNLMAKLKLHKQSDLVHYAIKAGLAKL